MKKMPWKTLAAYLMIPVLMGVAFHLFPDRAVGLFTLGMATVVWWVFIIWYAIRSKWWRNKYSRNLMSVGVGIAALLTTFDSVILFGLYPGYEIVYTVVFTSLVILGIQRTYYMEMSQREE